jgi:Lrp/AsnC family leucine-responsive transcriptional regulator
VISKQRQVLLDDVDRKALACLVRDGRISWADLASQLGLSAPAAAERVRKLEQRGVIAGYAARIAPETVGMDVTAFVAIRRAHTREPDKLLRQIDELDAVLECHHVAGDDDYLLKVRVGDLRALEALIAELRKSAVVVQTRTTIVMSTTKETPTPAPEDEP